MLHPQKAAFLCAGIACLALLVGYLLGSYDRTHELTTLRQALAVVGELHAQPTPTPKPCLQKLIMPREQVERLRPPAPPTKRKGGF